MKLLVSFIFVACISSCNLAQPKHLLSLEVIALKAKVITFFTDGNKDEFGQDMKIAFFKDYILFEHQVIHHKTQTFNNIKDADTITDGSEPDMTIEKITYIYYVYKKGEKRGLSYDERSGKTKEFSVDTLFIESNIGVDNEAGISMELGNPSEVKRQGNIWSERYYNVKNEKRIDTVFRSYDDALKDFPFSISKKLDREKNSKLIKSLQLIKIPPSLEIRKYKPFKLELLTEMELYTDKCSDGQLRKFKKYFNTYEKNIVKLKL
jgi:hypothetical protein